MKPIGWCARPPFHALTYLHNGRRCDGYGNICIHLTDMADQDETWRRTAMARALYPDDPEGPISKR
jgi:hypothetical protein